MKLKGKVAIVTGAGQGIGRAIALQLAEEGAKVVVSDITDLIQDVALEIRRRKQEALAVKTDVTSMQQVQAMVKATVDHYGRVDILVNNAGIYPYKALIEMEEKDWDRVIAVNLKGVFNCTKAVLPGLQKQGGNIVNIASIAGAVTGFRSLSHYSASKGGILGFTRATALELAPHKIRVNAVAPGAVDTPTVQQSTTAKERQETEQAIPLKRFGQPEDIAKLVLFLVSDDSSYITGQLIVIDGGWTLQ